MDDGEWFAGGLADKTRDFIRRELCPARKFERRLSSTRRCEDHGIRQRKIVPRNIGNFGPAPQRYRAFRSEALAAA